MPDEEPTNAKVYAKLEAMEKRIVRLENLATSAVFVGRGIFLLLLAVMPVLVGKL